MNRNVQYSWSVGDQPAPRGNVQSLEQRLENLSNELSACKLNNMKLEKRVDNLTADLSVRNGENQSLEQRVEDLTTVVNYMASEDPEEALRLLPVSVRLGIKLMSRKMSFQVMNIVSVANCVQIFQLAGFLGLGELREKVYSFIVDNFQKVVTTNQDFCGLTLAELCDFLESDDLEVDNESMIFEAIIRWIKSNNETRMEYVPVLVRRVRLPCLDRNSLTWMRDHHLIQDFQSMVTTVQSAVSEVDKFSRKERAFQLKRGKREVLVLLGGDPSSNAKVEVFDEVSYRWAHQINVRRPPGSYTWSALIGSKVLVIEDEGRKVRLFNPGTGEWTARASLPFPRFGICVAALHDMVYVMGGEISNVTQSRCHVYHLKEDTWLEIAPLNTGRYWSGAVACKGKVFCAAGRNSDGKRFDSVEVYDPEKNLWTFTFSLSQPRSAPALAACQDFVWSFGGFTGQKQLANVERLNPDGRSKWEFMTPMPTARNGARADYLGGRFYVIGGHDGKFSEATEIYDPTLRMWEGGPRIKGGRECLGSAVIKMPRLEYNTIMERGIPSS